MRAFFVSLGALLIAAAGHAGEPASGRQLTERTATVEWRNPDSLARDVERRLLLPPTSSLKKEAELHSLTGTHTTYRLELQGRRVLGAGAATLSSAERGVVRVEAVLPRFEESIAPFAQGQADPLASIATSAPLRILATERVWYPSDTGLVDAELWTISDGTLHWSVITRRTDGVELEVTPHFYSTRPARIFPANPVQRLNAPALRDANDAAAAVPHAAYELVGLPGVEWGARLAGAHVSIAEISPPREGIPAPSDDLASLDRGDPLFEAANAYFHIDASQRYLQSLGYQGRRRIINRSLEVDPRALGGADNSFYIVRPGGGYLAFGIGGTDDAEDQDIILHEYAHAIQDAIAPGSFGGPSGSEARALGEGFSDYWAFSAGWADSLASGSNPFCLAEWDARCEGSTGCAYPSGAECLRRVDTGRTMREFRHSNGTGTEHHNGEIWSQALTRVFLSLVQLHGAEEGKRIADTLAIEAHFGVPPSPTFATVTRRMIQADAVLFGGAHRARLCSAFALSEILEPSSCSGGAPGAFYPGAGTGIIPDADPNGVRLTREVSDERTIERVFVQVEIEHPQRAELRIFLLAPDGTPVKLHDTSFADTASGIRVTFGLDAEPAESLEVLRGRQAAGTWTLHVVDTRNRDVGVVRSWGIAFLFREDPPAKRAGEQIAFIPVAGSTAGATGEWFASDLVLSAGEGGSVAEVWFNPASVQGTEQRFEITLAPQQTLRLDDVLRRLLGRGGSGTLEVRLLSGDLRATSAIGAGGDGELSQAVPALETSGVARAIGSSVWLAVPAAGVQDRVNVGIVETSGSSVEAIVRLWSLSKRRSEIMVQLNPRQLVQLPLDDGVTMVELVHLAGEGSVAGYLSLIHGGSGDPSYIPSASGEHRATVLPVISRGAGAAASWQSDLTLANPSGEPLEILLTLRDAGGRVESSRLVALDAHGTAHFHDVVHEIIPVDSFLGSLHIDPDGRLVIASSIRGSRPAGVVRQFIEPAPLGSESFEQLLLPSGATGAKRTNVILVSFDLRPLPVRLVLRAGTGEIAHEQTLTIPAGGVMIAPLPAGSASGRVELTAAASGRFASWISVIDNRSGDADTWRAVEPFP